MSILNNELNQLEQDAIAGLALTRVVLDRLPENVALTQINGFLNSCIFFVETERNRIQTIVDNFNETEATTFEEMQEAGTDLATKLGSVLETKIIVSSIKTRIENLQ